LRLALAATVSTLYGVYSGHEFCENTANPGTEEYLDSEKYEIRVRDTDAPGNIRDYIARKNAIRRENSALHEFRNLRIHDSHEGGGTDDPAGPAGGAGSHLPREPVPP
jgi:starch synthase (maltosyl-transferring)